MSLEEALDALRAAAKAARVKSDEQIGPAAKAFELGRQDGLLQAIGIVEHVG